MDLDSVKAIASSSPDRLDMAGKLIGLCDAKRIVEVGVWRGQFAEKILAECPSIEKYFLIDPWRKLPSWDKPFNVEDEVFRQVYDEAMKRTDPYAAKRIILRGTTTEVCGEIEDSSIDLAYIDGDHTLRGIIVDLVNVFPKVRPGGLIVGDDCVADIFQHGLDYEPTLVFQGAVSFAEAVGATFFVSPTSQFVLVKPADGAHAFAMADLDGRYGNPALKAQLAPRRIFKRWLKSRLPNALSRRL